MKLLKKAHKADMKQMASLKCGQSQQQQTLATKMITRRFKFFTLLQILVILVASIPVNCQNSTSASTISSDKVQQSTSTTPPTTTTTTTSTTTTSTTTTLAASESAEPANATTTGELLLSRDEFVEATERPTLLYDGTSNESANNTESKPSSEISSPTGSFSSNSTTKEIAENNDQDATTTPANANEPEEEGELEEGGEGEFANSGGEAKDLKVEFEPPQNVSQYMDYIERLFHDLRHQITDLFEPHIPQLIRTSQMVQLSGSCSYDMLRLALALRQFEPWALRMIDSSGKVPEGILEGSFTALGSYDECLGTVFGGGPSGDSTSSSAHQQPTATPAGGQQAQPTPTPAVSLATRGKYCLVNVSPFLPPKPQADRVERMFQEEANRRNYTKDDQFSRLSGMFYYMKFRVGVCVPSSCLESDLDSISSALRSSLRLNITIPHCRMQQQHQPISGPQLVGGLAFALVLSAVLSATLLDYSRRRRRKWSEKREDHLAKVLEASGCCVEKPTSNGFSCAVPAVTLLRARQEQQQQNLQPVASSLNRRLDKHWSWLSFSLLTNYKLYFGSSSVVAPPRKSGADTAISAHAACACSQPPMTNNEPLGSSSPIIRCLNGIRVLSLCWVIVANSYITLDPRATKRLAQTREAPKDFLFQLVVQASLAIETFFFLSGVLMSLSFGRKLSPKREGNSQVGTQCETASARHTVKPAQASAGALQWFHFYVHRYVRMTPATMLVIAFTMFAYNYGDGPLWFEATHKAHQSCSQNWWRHLLHVANYIDTRQMCFIHYWYIAADMQLFLFAPLLMLLLYKRRKLGYALTSLIGLSSIGSVFYTTYMHNLPPTLLFYNSDPESRREFGNTIMTKPLTHALPYMVGMLVGKWLTSSATMSNQLTSGGPQQSGSRNALLASNSMSTLIGLIATCVALVELFLPYKWNNSHLPSRLLASIYAALFRFGWSLVLAYLVISCRHKRDKRCRNEIRLNAAKMAAKSAMPLGVSEGYSRCRCCSMSANKLPRQDKLQLQGGWQSVEAQRSELARKLHPELNYERSMQQAAADETLCLCGSGGNVLNRLLSLAIFTQMSKLSFVAYLIHLPLMSVFVAQTRGLFAFSHTLVIHLALSYLVMTFILSFILVHIIEFPFITFERYLFEKLFYRRKATGVSGNAQHMKEATKDAATTPAIINAQVKTPGVHWKSTRTTVDHQHANTIKTTNLIGVGNEPESSKFSRL